MRRAFPNWLRRHSELALLPDKVGKFPFQNRGQWTPDPTSLNHPRGGEVRPSESWSSFPTGYQLAIIGAWCPSPTPRYWYEPFLSPGLNYR